MHDVVVIGGGPAGTISAGLLAKDHDVIVIEEHDVSGTPLQCTGLITQDVIDMSGVAPDILNRIYGANVFFPNGNVLEVRSKNVKAVLIDREDLDRKLAEKAMDSGAEILYGKTYEGHKVLQNGISVTVDGNEISAKIMVGADGQRSRTAMSVPENSPKEYVYGIQADIRSRKEESDIMDLRIGSEFAPGFFSWEIPFEDFTRVGLCVSQAGGPNDYLKRLLKKTGLQDSEVIRKYSGKIPLGGRKRTYGDRLVLIGDAAGQVKPISGGGLYPIMKAAPHLKDAVSNALSTGNTSAKALSTYEKAWKKEIGKELSRGYRIRKMYTKLTDDDYNKVYDIMERENIKKILNDISVDEPSSVAPFILKNPRAAVSFLPIILKALL